MLSGVEIAPNSVEYLSQFQVPDEYFKDPTQTGSIHGRAHMYRDLVIAMYLVGKHPRENVRGAEPIQLYPYEIDAIAISAVTHDLKRTIHNAPDDGHGKLAAEWLHDTFFVQNPTGVPLSGFVRMSYLLAQYIVEFHEPPDHESTMSVLLKFLKDADALDRDRDPNAGENDLLNPDFLRLDMSVQIIEQAKEFTRLSTRLIQMGLCDFDAVMLAGMEVGFINQ